MKKQHKYGSIFLKGLCLFMSVLFLLSNASSFFILKSINEFSKANQLNGSSKETDFQISENNLHIIDSQVFVELIEVLELEDDETPCVLILGSVSLFKTFFVSFFSYYNYSKKPSLASHPIFLLFKVFRL